MGTESARPPPTSPDPTPKTEGRLRQQATELTLNFLFAFLPETEQTEQNSSCVLYRRVPIDSRGEGVEDEGGPSPPPIKSRGDPRAVLALAVVACDRIPCLVLVPPTGKHRRRYAF